EQRRIERLSVEADESTGARELVGDRPQQHPLVRVADEEELARDERAVAFEPPAADEEGQRSRPTAQPRRLEVEEQKRRPRRDAAGEQRRLTRCLLEPLGQRADPFPAME